MNPASRLLDFNTQVLAHQDQAFTLACWLLPDEPAAEQAVQRAVRAAFSIWSGDPDENLALILLSATARACRGTHTGGGVASFGLPTHLSSVTRGLSFEQRLALALVDGLGLPCAEAARVAGCSADRLRKSLTAARAALIA